MGIIDDYYGGYENLAMYTDEDGCVDFDAAYHGQLAGFDDDDDDYGYGTTAAAAAARPAPAAPAASSRRRPKRARPVAPAPAPAPAPVAAPVVARPALSAEVHAECLRLLSISLPPQAVLNVACRSLCSGRGAAFSITATSRNILAQTHWNAVCALWDGGRFEATAFNKKGAEREAARAALTDMMAAVASPAAAAAAAASPATAAAVTPGAPRPAASAPAAASPLSPEFHTPVPAAAVASAAGASGGPPRVLLVGNLGPLMWEDDFNVKRLQPLLAAAGFDVQAVPFGIVSPAGRSSAASPDAARTGRGEKAMVDLRTDRQLADLLANGGFSACIVVGFDSDGAPFQDGPWRLQLTAFVDRGGTLLLHGEQPAAAVLRDWFGRSWTMRGDFYRRLRHTRVDAGPGGAAAAARAAATAGGAPMPTVPDHYNVKACMLSDVPIQEQIYAAGPDAVTESLVPSMAGAAVEPGRCPFALGSFGRGRVGYYGDVNAEPATLQLVTAFLLQAQRTRDAAAR